MLNNEKKNRKNKEILRVSHDLFMVLYNGYRLRQKLHLNALSARRSELKLFPEQSSAI